MTKMTPTKTHKNMQQTQQTFRINYFLCFSDVSIFIFLFMFLNCLTVCVLVLCVKNITTIYNIILCMINIFKCNGLCNVVSVCSLSCQSLSNFNRLQILRPIILCWFSSFTPIIFYGKSSLFYMIYSIAPYFLVVVFFIKIFYVINMLLMTYKIFNVSFIINKIDFPYNLKQKLYYLKHLKLKIETVIILIKTSVLKTQLNALVCLYIIL